MNPVQCNVALATGDWRTEPTLAAVRNILGFYFGRALLAVDAVESEPDVVLQLEVTAYLGWGYGHEEAVRDRIAEALLRRFRPEYESMVEVEIVYKPDGPFNDPFGYVQDEMDDWNGFGIFDGIQQVWH